MEIFKITEEDQIPFFIFHSISVPRQLFDFGRNKNIQQLIRVFTLV